MARDRLQDMEDEAQLYCRSAASAIRNGQWEAACIELLARCRVLDMALQSLTPGGSEYVGNPDLCVRRARENLDNYRQLWREAVAKNRSAETNS